MIRKSLLLSAASLLALAGAQAQTVTVTNAKIWTGTDAGTIENGTVIIENGRITAIGGSVVIPAGAEQIDASGKWVTPGIFAGFSRVGIVEVGAEDSTNDINAALSPYSVALDASDGFNPAASTIPVTRLEGVTRLGVAPAPSTSIFAGQGFIADTSGSASSVTKPKAFVHVAMGESGAALAGGSRPSSWAMLRAAITDARMYPARYQAHKEGGDALNRIDAQAFGPAARGEQLILISASRASDLRQIIALSNERPELDIAIVGAEEGWMVASELAAANIPVIIDPFDNLPSRFDNIGATQENAARLVAAGVKTAFVNLGDNGHQARLVLQNAGNAVANGVSHDDAMEAVTGAPAEIFGMEGLGDLTAGATADLVIWDGDPLEVSSSPDAVFINGVRTNLESRQTKLRDRYLSLERGDKPLAYTKP